MRDAGQSWEAQGNTGMCDLGSTAPLVEPWQIVNGQRFPRFSREAASLSLALAHAAYTMDMDAWREAGWRDLTFQIDNKLYSGGVKNEEGHFLHEALADWVEYLARNKAKRAGLLSQYRGTLRQREAADTCKAVVMIHKALGGRYVVAIGFMGTGKRIYDWISNFRLENEAGLHQGFRQLTDEFIGKSDEISFPMTAAELGLGKLTLKDIFNECKSTGSRFSLWMAGHSQGGAIMQVLMYHLVMNGVRRSNLLGYGFASPSVVYGSLRCDLTGFPVYHIISSDDVTPRIGAVSHIGRCRVMNVDDAMARRCYLNLMDDAAFFDILRMMRTVRCTSDAAVWMVGFLRSVRELPPEDLELVYRGLFRIFMNDRLYDLLSERLYDLMACLIRKAEDHCKSILGVDSLPSANLMRYDRVCGDLIRKYGAPEFIRALLCALARPHKIRTEHPEEGEPPYQYMVLNRLGDIKDVIFSGNAPHMWAGIPKKTYARPKAKRPHTHQRFAALAAGRARRN